LHKEEGREEIIRFVVVVAVRGVGDGYGKTPQSRRRLQYGGSQAKKRIVGGGKRPESALK